LIWIKFRQKRFIVDASFPAAVFSGHVCNLRADCSPSKNFFRRRRQGIVFLFRALR